MLYPVASLTLCLSAGYGFKGILEAKSTASQVVSFIMAAVMAALYFKTKHWTMNNFFGVSFAIQVILVLFLLRGSSCLILLRG